MKANELRIGNLVKTTERDIKSVFKVIGIGEQFIDLECIDGSDPFKEVYGVELPSVLPIHLTEEWLVKLGFEDDNQDDRNKYNFTTVNWCRQYPFWFWVYQETDEQERLKRTFRGELIGEFSVYTNQFFVCPVKYVHQLQNLYFALKGDELNMI